MTYLTVKAFIKKFDNQELKRLTNLNDRGADHIDEDLIAEKIAEAEGIVNSYMSSTTLIALQKAIATAAADVSSEATGVPVVLIGHTANIVRYLLDYMRTRDDVRERYEDAIGWLTKLSRNEVSLGIDTGGATVESSSAVVAAVSSAKPSITRDSLSPYNLQPRGGY